MEYLKKTGDQHLLYVGILSIFQVLIVFVKLFIYNFKYNMVLEYQLYNMY